LGVVKSETEARGYRRPQDLIFLAFAFSQKKANKQMRHVRSSPSGPTSALEVMDSTNISIEVLVNNRVRVLFDQTDQNRKETKSGAYERVVALLHSMIPTVARDFALALPEKATAASAASFVIIAEFLLLNFCKDQGGTLTTSGRKYLVALPVEGGSAQVKLFWQGVTQQMEKFFRDPTQIKAAVSVGKDAQGNEFTEATWRHNCADALVTILRRGVADFFHLDEATLKDGIISALRAQVQIRWKIGQILPGAPLTPLVDAQWADMVADQPLGTRVSEDQVKTFVNTILPEAMQPDIKKYDADQAMASQKTLAQRLADPTTTQAAVTWLSKLWLRHLPPDSAASKTVAGMPHPPPAAGAPEPPPRQRAVAPVVDQEEPRGRLPPGATLAERRERVRSRSRSRNAPAAGDPNNDRERRPKCSKCGEQGHAKADCPKYECLGCGAYAPGHTWPDCPDPDAGQSFAEVCPDDAAALQRKRRT